MRPRKCANSGTNNNTKYSGFLVFTDSALCVCVFNSERQECSGPAQILWSTRFAPFDRLVAELPAVMKESINIMWLILAETVSGIYLGDKEESIKRGRVAHISHQIDFLCKVFSNADCSLLHCKNTLIIYFQQRNQVFSF